MFIFIIVVNTLDVRVFSLFNILPFGIRNLEFFLHSISLKMSRRLGHPRVEEEDDDDPFNELSSRVKLLKTISIEIGEETRQHIKYLKELDEKADSSSNFLSRNMEHVKRLARGGHNNLVFYLIAFALFVMIVIYFINKSLG